MREVLRAPGAAVLFAASCVARLPTGAMGLLLVLHTERLTGSFAAGGVAAGAYGLAMGLANPSLARLVDRRGQTLVLRVGGALAALTLVALALLPDRAPLGAIVAGAALAGAAQPPIGACMRALWPVLLDGPERRHAAYALESMALELVYLCGPLAVVAGIGSFSTRAAVLSCAAFVLAGDLTFSVQPGSRAWRPHPDRPRDLAGTLRSPGVRVLIAVFVLCGLTLGGVEVALPAALAGMGRPDLTGFVFACWSVGAILAGLLAARRGAARDPARRLTWLLAAWGIGHAALALAAAPAALALLLLAAGTTIAPTFACANGMLDRLAPTGSLTEAFTWTSTGVAAGGAAGSVLAGAIVARASTALAFGVLGAAGLLAALLVGGTACGALRTVRPARPGDCDLHPALHRGE